jgi:hypothetical protein
MLDSPFFMASKAPPLLEECVAYVAGSNPAATINNLQALRMVDEATFSAAAARRIPPVWVNLQVKNDFGSPNFIPMKLMKAAMKTPTQFGLSLSNLTQNENPRGGFSTFRP